MRSVPSSASQYTILPLRSTLTLPAAGLQTVRPSASTTQRSWVVLPSTVGSVNGSPKLPLWAGSLEAGSAGSGSPRVVAPPWSAAAGAGATSASATTIAIRPAQPLRRFPFKACPPKTRFARAKLRE